MQPTEPVCELTRRMRVLLVVAGVLVFLAGVQLFVFPLRTERYFSWTIAPPMTAVFLGASYWSSLVFEWSAARRTRWADARIAVPTVFVFTTLTLIATLVHADKFHFGGEHETTTRVVTWVWLAIYVIVPVLMVVLSFEQRRVPGRHLPRSQPLDVAVRSLIAIDAAALLAVGVALFAVPDRTAGIWPWALTPLTARAVGAWCVGLGVAAAHSWWENDVGRLRPAANAFLAFGLLQGVSLLRHGDDLSWDRPAAWIFAAVLVSAVLIGLRVMAAARRSHPADAGPDIDARDVVDLRPTARDAGSVEAQPPV